MDYFWIFRGDALGRCKYNKTDGFVNVLDEGKDAIQLLIVLNLV